MGIIRNTTENNCSIAIWDTQETLNELLKLSRPFDLTKFKTEKRKKEFLASRLLVQEISQNTIITYNEFGAPELDNGKYISISHSKEMVAIIISEQQVGMDVEQISEKVLHLSSKFVSEKNLKNLSKEKATLIWCCKEAVFKWHQTGGVDFIKDIIIPEFSAKEKGEIAIQFKNKELNLNYQKINNHYLVYVCK
ncbi:MAG: 4'-phosphopantetheinyl transferase superfamily protein [Flavobacteriales bacterium]|jgi:4'-phosphopantetheinyl transferase|nr:4'-phosphopantetheinyl transferase superfamily protein [Flavobacteriales bacterium]